MTALHVAWFAGALAVAAAVPGPAVMATIGRVFLDGDRGALAFSLGLVIGDLLWLWIATLGLGAAAGAFGPVLRWGELLGAAYLAWIAYRMATSTPVVPVAAPATAERRAFVSGLLLQIGNPKAVLFYAALVPAIVPLGTLRVAHLVVLSAVVAIVVLAVNLSYVRGAALARRYLRSPRALRAIHRISALVLAATAATVVLAAIGTSP
jgi:threonine/homoserine/homoserine lactone efflux protein